MAKKILYITYDGLTDPLGQSQILPYLCGLSKEGYQFTILSFEKEERFLKEQSLIRSITSGAGIDWVPLPFTRKPPLLSKAWDAMQMKRTAVRLHKEQKFDLVHCRSYVAAAVGLHLKQHFGIRFLFDMRGFWADEKKEGGSWNMANPVYRQIYRYYKKQEAQYLQHADAIISLTHAGKREMQRWPAYNPQVPIIVIPTCTDMEHFSLTTPEDKRRSREALRLPQDALVLSYLGSVGAWYMLDEMLAFFRTLHTQRADARFLIITHSDKAFIRRAALDAGIEPGALLITEASRDEVPLFMKASDLSLSLIRPVYSKMASSPTKLGEVLSMGIPIICNAGVGDAAGIVEKAGAGLVIRDCSPEDLRRAVADIPELLRRSPAAIRAAITPVVGLEQGTKAYLKCYRMLLG